MIESDSNDSTKFNNIIKKEHTWKFCIRQITCDSGFCAAKLNNHRRSKNILAWLLLLCKENISYKYKYYRIDM